MATKIIDCNCEHEYQDQKYGKGKRVANKAPKANGWRCTVCGKVHTNATAPKK